MKLQTLLVLLTVANAAMLGTSLLRPAAGQAQSSDGVLRGRALEIVDEHGRVRASIGMIRADPSVRIPDGGSGYPETVLLRLIDERGRPNVKLQATRRGGGLGLGGQVEPAYVQLGGERVSLVLTGQDGRRRVIAPDD